MEGVNPCARCAAPSRDPLSGEVSDASFAKTFAEHREMNLPAWSDRRRFDHFYRLAVNTRVPESESGKTLGIGDVLALTRTSRQPSFQAPGLNLG